MTLITQHHNDLKRSGLSDATIEEAGIFTVPPDQFKKRLGFPDKGIESLMAIPFYYGDTDDEYTRYKVWYQRDAKAGPKYLSQRGALGRLFIPIPAYQSLSDVAIPLYITEGEKKSLKACQEGINCIGITGMWNWKVKESEDLIPDFNLIELQGRKVVIVPDSDWIDCDKRGRMKNLAQAVSRLGAALLLRGAKVYWKEIG